MGEEQQILLLFLFFFLAALLTNRRRLQKGIEVDFRILPAFNKLRNVVPRAVESGKKRAPLPGPGGYLHQCDR